MEPKTGLASANNRFDEPRYRRLKQEISAYRCKRVLHKPIAIGSINATEICMRNTRCFATSSGRCENRRLCSGPSVNPWKFRGLPQSLSAAGAVLTGFSVPLRLKPHYSQWLYLQGPGSVRIQKFVLFVHLFFLAISAMILVFLGYWGFKVSWPQSIGLFLSGFVLTLMWQPLWVLMGKRGSDVEWTLLGLVIEPACIYWGWHVVP